MKVLYGYDIPKSMYPKIADLDSEVFSEGAEEFSGDTTMPKETVIGLLEKNILSTVILVDDNDEVIAYYQTFPMVKEFEERYVRGEATFKELDGDKLLGSSAKNINLYVWSIGITKAYRGVKVKDPSNPEQLVAIPQLLHEGLVDALVDLKKSGVNVQNIFGEGVSEKGVALMKSICGENSLIHKDEENEFYMYGSQFNVDCPAFARCRNIEKLKKAYSAKQNSGEVLSENIEKLKDDSNVDAFADKKENEDIT